MSDSIVGKEYLPNVHIEKIIAQRLPEDGSGRDRYKVKYIVSCYDYDQPTWSSDEKFTGYLKIMITKSIVPHMSEKIESGELSLNYFGSNIEFGFSDATKSRVSIRGKNYRKFQFTTSRTNQLNGHLSMYCASAIELQDLKDNEGLDLSYTQTQSYMGAVSGERIIVDGEPVEAATIFYDESEIPWSGPVHLMDTGSGAAPTIKRYMAGSQHGATQEENLVSETITNNKIEYLERQVSLDLDTFVGPTLQSTRPQVNLQSRVLGIPIFLQPLDANQLVLCGQVVPHHQLHKHITLIHKHVLKILVLCSTQTLKRPKEALHSTLIRKQHLQAPYLVLATLIRKQHPTIKKSLLKITQEMYQTQQ